MKKFIFIIMCAVAAMGFTACNNDGLSLDEQWEAWAVVERPVNAGSFYLITDGGSRLWVANPFYGPEDGDRVYVNFTILSNRPAEIGYDHDVRVNGIRTILSKNAVVIAEDDELPNDVVVGMRSIWNGGGFINFDVVFYGDHKTHIVNLCRNDSKTYDDGKLHLEFRHDRNGDALLFRKWALVSFDPRSVIPADMIPVDGKLDVVIHYTTSPNPGGQPVEKTFELKYSPSLAEGASALQSEHAEGYFQ